MSDLMGRENHIFTVVPRGEVEDELDWRLPVFEAGQFFVAFDGAVLLMPELERRVKAGAGHEERRTERRRA